MHTCVSLTLTSVLGAVWATNYTLQKHFPDSTSTSTTRDLGSTSEHSELGSPHLGNMNQTHSCSCSDRADILTSTCNQQTTVRKL